MDVVVGDVMLLLLLLWCLDDDAGVACDFGALCALLGLVRRVHEAALAQTRPDQLAGRQVRVQLLEELATLGLLLVLVRLVRVRRRARTRTGARCVLKERLLFVMHLEQIVPKTIRTQNFTFLGMSFIMLQSAKPILIFDANKDTHPAQRLYATCAPSKLSGLVYPRLRRRLFARSSSKLVK